jgi:hypothetical protein
MQMIGQNHPTVDPEWALVACLPYCGPQSAYLTQQKIATSLLQGNGEEDRGTLNAGAAIIRHAP